MKPIIQMLFVLVTAILALAFAHDAQAADKRYPTQYDFQQIVVATINDVALDADLKGEYYALPDGEKTGYIFSLALEEADRRAAQHDIELSQIHLSNLLLTLIDSVEKGKYWYAKPTCSHYRYRQLLKELFPTTNQDLLINLALKVKSCQMETL